MKRLVLLGAMLILTTVLLSAQATNIHSSGTLPTNCSVGNIYLKTGSSAGFYICLSTDTWTGPLATGGGGAALSAVTAATGANTIASGDSHSQLWNWALTSDFVSAFTFGETTAATGGSAAGSQRILSVTTLASSTASPLIVEHLGANNYSFAVFDEASDTTPFVVTSTGRVGVSRVPTQLALEVGPTSDSGDNLLGLVSAADGDFYLQMVSSEWRFRSAAAKPLVFLVNSVEEARVDASGIRATGYQAADGSAGVTVTSCTQFEEGICTAGTEPAMTMEALIAEVLALRQELAALRAEIRR